MKHWQKIILGVVLASFITASLPGLFASRPPALIPKAHASVPSFEVNPAALGSFFGIDVSSLGTLVQILLEWTEQLILQTLKKRLLDAIVDQIIGWIQGEGEPKFITNWQGFLKDAANAAVGDFAQAVDLDFLCKPFKFQFGFALGGFALPEFPVQRFHHDVECTLDDIVKNIGDFYEDFRNGGVWKGRPGSWFAFAESIKPQNDFFMTTLKGQIAAAIEGQKAKHAAENEALAGLGFLGTKKCKKDRQGRDIPGTCTVTTPGSLAGDLAAKAVGTDIDYILSADELKSYVAAIVNAIANRLISAGSEGLFGVSTSNAPEGGTFSGSGVCEDLPPEMQDECDNYENMSEGEFQSSVQTFHDELHLSLDPRLTAKDVYPQAINELNSFVDDLETRGRNFDSRRNSQADCPAGEDDVGDNVVSRPGTCGQTFTETVGDYNYCRYDNSGVCQNKARCEPDEVRKLKYGDDQAKNGVGGMDGEKTWATGKADVEIPNKMSDNQLKINALVAEEPELHRLMGEEGTDENRAAFAQIVIRLRGILSAGEAQRVKLDAEGELSGAKTRREEVLKTLDKRFDYCAGQRNDRG